MTSPIKPGSKPLSKDEFTALGTIARARQENLVAMFTGAEIVYGKWSKAKAVKSLGGAASEIKDNVTKLGGGGGKSGMFGLRAQAEKLILDAVGVDQLGDLIGVITNEAVEHLVKEMIPYVGIITSSYKAASAWKAVVDQARKSLAWDAYTGMVLPGDPLAACAAVHTILKRNIARDTAEATIQTTAVAMKLAGLAGDMGSGATTTAIGLASGIASLAVELTQLGIDIHEMRAGNKRLKTPQTIDKSVFTECPLVGSYLMAYSPPSMLLNFFVADIGLPGWMDKIEKFKREGLDPIVETAAEQISRSRITMVNFKTGKGYVPEKSMGDKLSGLSWKNMKFQFNRLVRSRIPF